MNFIRPLNEVGQEDVADAGGKGANLGVLLRGGFPVPFGYVLLTSAYERFVQYNAFQEGIERLASSATLDDINTIESISSSIRMLFEKGQIPDEIIVAVKDAYVVLGRGPVAIRSSATAEDLPHASFAGQQETYLQIQSEDSVLNAIKQCWSSLWTERALSYRLRQGIPSSALRLAVVVQHMIQADVSGVLFTINPVTGNSDEMVINAVLGLGEALVEGRVTPDIITVDKGTGTVEHLEVGGTENVTVSAKQNIQEGMVASQQQKPVLTDEQILALNRLGKEIETHFRTSQDIEWAIEGEHIFILQARPVTTSVTDIQSVPPGDDNWDEGEPQPPQPFDVWTRTNVGENLPFPITPLTSTNFARLFGLDAQTAQGVRRFYGRIYINEGAVIHDLTEKYGLPSNMIDKMWGSRPRGTGIKRHGFRPWRLVPTLLNMLSQSRNAPKRPKQPEQPKQPRHTPQEFFAQIDQWVATFVERDLSVFNDSELWSAGLPTWSERGKYVFNTNLRLSVPSAMFYVILERLTKWWTPYNTAQNAVTGLPGVYSAEVGPLLWQIASTLRQQRLHSILLDNNPTQALRLLQEESEAVAFLQQFEGFLERHGHRCPNEVELLNPRWAEAPEQVIELLANYLQVDESVNPIETEKRQQQRREETVASMVARLDPMRKIVFRFLLKKAQQAIVDRDNSRFYVTKFLFPIRKVYAQFGRRWTERGWLRRYDDVFFLKTTEIQEIAEHGLVSEQELQTRVADRRAAHDYWLTIIAPDALGPDGKPLVESKQTDHMLIGVAASSGRVRGRARIIQNVRELGRLTHEDILVTQATDPGWTPIFPLVKAIVLEVGGQLSHGAIVAREYGIPAVVNVQGALQRIHDGQYIIVDGTQGSVYLEDEKGYNL